jgi:hypothetical protein
MKDIISIMNEDQTKHQTEKDGISRFINVAAAVTANNTDPNISG